MPVWTIIDSRTGIAESITADQIEDDGNGWSWWSVVVIVNSPRWSCVRRVPASELAGAPYEEAEISAAERARRGSNPRPSA